MQSVKKPDDAGNLNRLKATASTARVLNLHQVAIDNVDNPEHGARPLFSNGVLNHSIIIKHKLRPNELLMFDKPRASATKLLLMLDRKDLKIGARSVFVGQTGFADLLGESLGVRKETHATDLRMLSLLDSLPSLDPFIVRERLKTAGFDPAPCYLAISQADSQKIFDFALVEIMPLAELMCSTERLTRVYADKLARKVIFDAGQKEFEPLRLAMRLDDRQFIEGMFCWKAFIYYKWRINALRALKDDVIREIGAIVASRGRGGKLPENLPTARQAVLSGIDASLEDIEGMLDIYDEAYKSMTVSGKTAQFKDFLMLAPMYFNELSARIAGIDHVMSYWRHRQSLAGDGAIPGDELIEILEDFRASLQMGDPNMQPAVTDSRTARAN